MTRQRQWQLDRKAEGQCTKCAKPAVNATHCDDHRLAHNKWNKAYKLRIKEGR
jgi:hypothetical protein